MDEFLIYIFERDVLVKSKRIKENDFRVKPMLPSVIKENENERLYCFLSHMGWANSQGEGYYF